MIAAFALIGCNRASGDQVTRLNGPDYRPKAAVTSSVDVSSGQKISHTAAIGQLRQIASYNLGSASSGSGQPQDAAFGPDESIFFVEPAAPEVFQITADGEVRSVLPQQISPDFAVRTPTAILRLSDSQWAVVDRTSKLKVFSFDGEQLVPVRTASVIDATDACLLGDSVVLRGAEKPVQRYRLEDGQELQQYGEAFEHSFWLVRRRLAEGLVGCRDTDSLIATTSMALPFVYGYTPDGTLQWVTEVKGLTPTAVSLVKTETGQLRVRNAGANFDLPWRFTPLDDARMLFQFLRIQREPAAPTQVHSIVLSTRTGHGEYVGTELPWIVGGAWPRLIAFDQESGAISIHLLEK
ncbi:MAG: hypothetical protein ABS36_00030 [Acidobacteria bacterium SCN 69-37]|nr:MAG: hypothetical protein ABS36_00030 [Acidobacteria bacterium SCN 69-37]